jgi:DNA-damage-inducible protein D
MDNIKLFEEKKVRSHWDEREEQWYFALVDIVAALTDSANATDYLKKIRKRDEELHFYLGTNCPQVEMLTESGKKRKTLAGNVQQVFRLIQSIPSPKAEPFKQWLARVGYERMKEIADPEQSIERAAGADLQSAPNNSGFTILKSTCRTFFVLPKMAVITCFSTDPRSVFKWR